MGAGDWVSGGLRRAVSGVRSAMPGQGDQEPSEDPAAPPATAPPGAALQAAAPRATPPAKQAPGAKRAPAAKRAASKDAPAATKAPVVGKATAAMADPAEAPAEVPAIVDPPAPAWTDLELAGFREALEVDIHRLREELHMGEADMADLLADSSDSAGDDQADAGSKTLEREQEMSVNANARDLLDQSTHALRRLEAGTYGICESCGSVIPAGRLRAFPRATLCIACKQAEERR